MPDSTKVAPLQAVGKVTPPQAVGKVTPSQAVGSDASHDRAPDPRRHYASPEDLSADIELDLAEREELLRQWKQDLDQRLEAESEGMSAQDPMSQDKESQLANEVRRVSALLVEMVEEREKAAKTAEAAS